MISSSESKPTMVKAWWAALRPKTLSAALPPVILATALAYLHHSFKIIPACLCLLFASLMQIASNLINDLYDFLHGTDTEKRLGPPRACAMGWISIKAMKCGIFLVCLLATITGLFLIPFGGFFLIYIGLSCFIGAFLYTLWFSHIALGDLLVLIFFGIIPTTLTYYVQAQAFSITSLYLGIACGLYIDALLIINNYRDIETDSTANKKTIIVLIGKKWGRYLYLSTAYLALLFIGLTLIELSISPIFYLSYLPFLYLHHKIYRRLYSLKGKELNQLLGLTSANILLFMIITLCLYSLSIIC